MMQAAKLELNDEVDASIEEGKIIVQRAVKRKYMLKELLKGVTPESCTDPFESLPPAGHEVW